MATQNDSMETIFGDVDPRQASASEPAAVSTQTGGVAQATEAEPVAAEPNATPAHDEDAVEVVIRSGGKAVPLPAVLKERKQRQERQATLERELAEARGQLSVYSQSRRPVEQEQAPSDPDAPFYDQGPKKFVASEVSAVRQEFNDRLVRMSAAQMRTAHADFDDVARAFTEAANANPQLEAACLQSDNPALYAYQNGKAYLEAKKYGGSFENMREAIRKEEEAKAEAKYRKQGALDAAANASTSTAGARSVGNAPTHTGPATLQELFPGAL